MSWGAGRSSHRLFGVVLCLASATAACESRSTTSAKPANPPASQPTESVTASVPPADAAVPRSVASAEPRDAFAPPEIKEEVARRALFGTSIPVEASKCEGDTRTKIACWLEARYAGDEEAKKLVLDLYARFRTVVGQGESETMDGGYRGHIRLVPTLPIGKDRKHLVWLHSALDTIDRVMTALASRAKDPKVTMRYHYRPVLVKFVRSLDGKHTPSGFALDWTYAYNVEGSLNTSAEAVLNLAVHEIFHLNDTEESRAWSDGALGTDVSAILKKCKVPDVKAAGASTPCLAPYAPTPLQVRGGTYYAFQPGNRIVLEYAAELSTRVFDEERAQLGLGPKRGPFKCGPPENARSWKSMVDTYFGGVDLVPACP